MNNKDIKVNIVSNCYWIIRDIMEDNGYSSSEYSVDLSYPNNEEEIRETPMICLETRGVISKAYELNSKSKQVVRISISIIDESRRRILQIQKFLWDNLHGKTKPFYDMTSSEPSAVGNYAGLSDVGVLTIRDGMMDTAPVTKKLSDIKYHYEAIASFLVEAGLD